MTTNADLNARRLAATPRGVATATTIFADRAENAELWDVEGRRYVDFAGGIAVLNTGHRHPGVVAAVEAQLARFTHTAYQVVPYEPYVELAERLNKLAPGATPKKTLFVTTGAEAVENAIKIARATATVERERFLLQRLTLHNEPVDRFIGAFQKPPLYSTAYDRGFGTLYTAVYWPNRDLMEFRWPGETWCHAPSALNEGVRQIRYPLGGPYLVT